MSEVSEYSFVTKTNEFRLEAASEDQAEQRRDDVTTLRPIVGLQTSRNVHVRPEVSDFGAFYSAIN